MIIGIGVDVVEIKRFAGWHTKSITSLRRIYSDIEIDYCLSNSIKSAERFAIRFAAREAVFKALSTTSLPSFLTLCQNVMIDTQSNMPPTIIFSPQFLKKPPYDDCNFWLSLSHSKTIACAQVIIEKR